MPRVVLASKQGLWSAAASVPISHLGLKHLDHSVWLVTSQPSVFPALWRPVLALSVQPVLPPLQPLVQLQAMADGSRFEQGLPVNIIQQSEQVALRNEKDFGQSQKEPSRQHPAAQIKGDKEALSGQMFALFRGQQILQPQMTNSAELMSAVQSSLSRSVLCATTAV